MSLIKLLLLFTLNNKSKNNNDDDNDINDNMNNKDGGHCSVAPFSDVSRVSITPFIQSSLTIKSHKKRQGTSMPVCI